jgi:hypothetical protein
MIGHPAKRLHICLQYCKAKATDILHSTPTEETYKHIIEALEGHYGDHQVAAAYWSQLKAKIQLRGESLQEFAAVTEQLA